MARRKPGEGQTALVTGASAGIGVDLAECFAKDGYDLILAARSESALGEVANRLGSAYGVKTHAIAQDLGAYGGGLIYDQLGSYTMAWRIGVALGLAGGIIQVAFALIRPSAPPMLKTA